MPAGGLSVDLLVMELPRTWVAEARHKACFYQRLHNDSCSDGPCRHRWSTLYTRWLPVVVAGRWRGGVSVERLPRARVAAARPKACLCARFRNTCETSESHWHC